MESGLDWRVHTSRRLPVLLSDRLNRLRELNQPKRMQKGAYRMSIRIAIADGQNIMCRIIRYVLRDEPDFDIVGEASDDIEAVKLVAQLAPDVVIMDIGIPEISGIEATHLVREFHPDVKLIVCSTYSTGAVIQRMLDAGAVGYVAKRSIGQDLCGAIRVVLKGDVYLSPEYSVDSLMND